MPREPPVTLHTGGRGGGGGRAVLRGVPGPHCAAGAVERRRRRKARRSPQAWPRSKRHAARSCARRLCSPGGSPDAATATALLRLRGTARTPAAEKARATRAPALQPGREIARARDPDRVVSGAAAHYSDFLIISAPMSVRGRPEPAGRLATGSAPCENPLTGGMHAPRRPVRALDPPDAACCLAALRLTCIVLRGLLLCGAAGGVAAAQGGSAEEIRWVCVRLNRVGAQNVCVGLGPAAPAQQPLGSCGQRQPERSRSGLPFPASLQHRAPWRSAHPCAGQPPAVGWGRCAAGQRCMLQCGASGTRLRVRWGGGALGGSFSVNVYMQWQGSGDRGGTHMRMCAASAARAREGACARARVSIALRELGVRGSHCS
jgi:hypothetical protein